MCDYLFNITTFKLSDKIFHLDNTGNSVITFGVTWFECDYSFQVPSMCGDTTIDSFIVLIEFVDAQSLV